MLMDARSLEPGHMDVRKKPMVATTAEAIAAQAEKVGTGSVARGADRGIPNPMIGKAVTTEGPAKESATGLRAENTSMALKQRAGVQPVQLAALPWDGAPRKVGA